MNFSIMLFFLFFRCYVYITSNNTRNITNRNDMRNENMKNYRIKKKNNQQKFYHLYFFYSTTTTTTTTAAWYGSEVSLDICSTLLREMNGFFLYL
jgi:hypothetical protein